MHNKYKKQQRCPQPSLPLASILKATEPGPQPSFLFPHEPASAVLTRDPLSGHVGRQQQSNAVHFALQLGYIIKQITVELHIYLLIQDKFAIDYKLLLWE